MAKLQAFSESLIPLLLCAGSEQQSRSQARQSPQASGEQAAQEDDEETRDNLYSLRTVKRLFTAGQPRVSLVGPSLWQLCGIFVAL